MIDRCRGLVSLPIGRPTTLRPPRIPSASTMSRRIDRMGLGLLWRAVEERLRTAGSPLTWLACLDGTPLAVGGHRNDPKACRGRGAGTMAKGYKHHAVRSTNGLPETWEVRPRNRQETTVARRLLPPWCGAGYLLADGNFVSNPRFDGAWQQG